MSKTPAPAEAANHTSDRFPATILEFAFNALAAVFGTNTADTITKNAERMTKTISFVFDAATVAGAFEKAYKHVQDIIEENDLPFSETQCRNAARRMVAAELQSLATIQFGWEVERMLPGYVKIDTLLVHFDFLKNSEIQEVPALAPGKPKRYRLVLRLSASTADDARKLVLAPVRERRAVVPDDPSNLAATLTSKKRTAA